MQKSYEVLKNGIEKVGAKLVAAKLNVSQSLVYKWCQDSDEANKIIPSGAANPLDRVQQIYDATQDPEMINWICQKADGFFARNPKDNEFPTIGAKVLKNVHMLIKEFSEALEAISQSYDEGKRITRKESDRIRKEWEDLKCIGEGFVRACESGKFEKN
ncbi:MAG: phage regulatory CII family protein [Candidatus Omnitrophota bacterium]